MQLILVNGAQRSGTTMLASLLGAAEGATVLPDSGLLAALARATRGAADRRRMSGPAFDAVVRSIRRMERWPVDHAALVAHRAQPDGTVQEHLDGFVRHLAGLRGEEGEPRFVVSHEPTDVFAMADIAATFDRPALVDLVRDGRAVARSLQNVSWGPASLVDAAREWERQVAYGQVALQHFRELGLPAVECRFEALMAEPAATLQAVCEAVGLPFSPEMATRGAFRPLRFSQADHALVGEAPEPSRSDAWRRELSTDEVRDVEHAVGGMLALLGYPLVTDGSTTPARQRREQLRRSIAGPARRLRHRATKNRLATRWR